MSAKNSKVVSVQFHSIGTVTLASGSSIVSVRPDNFGTSLASVSDGYELFRVTQLRLRIFAKTGVASTGVVSSVPNTSPTTLSQNGELLDSVQHEGPLETMWSRWLSVRKDTLRGPFEWYHTRAGTFDATESAPATICHAGTGTNTIDVEYYGTMQFKDPAATANTPAALEIRAQLRMLLEREQRMRTKAQVVAALAETGCVTPSLSKS